MRIIIIGATGTIGKELTRPLGGDPDIVPVAAHSGELLDVRDFVPPQDHEQPVSSAVYSPGESI